MKYLDGTDIVCKSCGSVESFIIKVEDNHKGLYCASCGKWVKWLGKQEFAFLKGNGVKVEDNSGAGCSKCGCMESYNKTSGPHMAKYCKQCNHFLGFVSKKEQQKKAESRQRGW